VHVRARDVTAEVESNLERNRRKQKKLEEKARAQAAKLERLNVAMETTLAESFTALTTELRSFGTAKGVKLKYLQDQYKSRNVRMKGVYLSIPTPSAYRSKTKPYKLRMQPHPISACKPSTDAQIAYVLQLLELMLQEDAGRHAQLTDVPEDNTVVRRLPVVSETYINPLAVHLKQEQKTRVAAMAAPKDNPWLAKLHTEYVGKILYDGGYFRVFDVLYVDNKGSRTRFPCWEATSEPVHLADDGAWVVHDRHLSTGILLPTRPLTLTETITLLTMTKHLYLSAVYL
jgi:hypothetical protein